jgi:ribonuclease P/MRP protein subunit RPP1
MRSSIALTWLVGYTHVAIVVEYKSKAFAQVDKLRTQVQVPGITVLWRLHVNVDSTQQNFGLGNSNEYSGFDLVSITPSNEAVLQAACANYAMDIITLDAASRLNFYIKIPIVQLAIARGIHFELTYADAIRGMPFLTSVTGVDVGSRRNIMANAKSLVRATKGKNILLSSGARSVMECRAPYDGINVYTVHK